MREVPKHYLGLDVQEAISKAKETFKAAPWTLKRFDGRELNEPLAKQAGAYFFECRVDYAHAGDPRRAGSRRLVGFVHSGRINKMYFSDNHYRPGSWVFIAHC